MITDRTLHQWENNHVQMIIYCAARDKQNICSCFWMLYFFTLRITVNIYIIFPIQLTCTQNHWWDWILSRHFYVRICSELEKMKEDWNVLIADAIILIKQISIRWNSNRFFLRLFLRWFHFFCSVNQISLKSDTELLKNKFIIRAADVNYNNFVDWGLFIKSKIDDSSFALYFEPIMMTLWST